jgi:hypothetical protein
MYYFLALEISLQLEYLKLTFLTFLELYGFALCHGTEDKKPITPKENVLLSTCLFLWSI